MIELTVAGKESCTTLDRACELRGYYWEYLSLDAISDVDYQKGIIEKLSEWTPPREYEGEFNLKGDIEIKQRCKKLGNIKDNKLLMDAFLWKTVDDIINKMLSEQVR